MNSLRTARMPDFASRLMGGASVAVMVALAATAAHAQAPSAPPAADSTVEAVVVTGTSIRGVAPVGATVTSVGQAQIQETAAQTVQQVLQSVPSVVGLGAAGQGGFGSADASGTNAPTIHGLGASASNSTLILIDGHRIPLSGINHALADPNMMPPEALQRVEVLAEGSSSVYGSDAVAGVINFISRRHYNGAEANVQAGFGDHYHTFSAGGVLGKTWDTGSFMAAYHYSWRGPLLALNRDFSRSANHLAQGGSNLSNFNCAPASIGIGSNIYLSPYTGAPITNAQVNSACDFNGYNDLVPKEVRHSVMAKVEQELNDRTTVHADFVYSNRQNTTRQTVGAITGTTIFGPGAASASQINPFFVLPTGAAATTTSETVRLDATGIFGPISRAVAGDEVHYFSGGVDFKVTNDWLLTVAGVAGADLSRNQTQNVLCTSCANLALNGTVNSGGSLTATAVPGQNIIVTNVPLTAANAFDPFRGRTSATTLNGLIDPVGTTFFARQTFKDATAKLDGPLFALPAGQVRVAVGGELLSYYMRQDVTQSLNVGPAATGSRSTNLVYSRNVQSEFAEVAVPVVAPSMSVPLVRGFDIDAAIRHDHYSDFGNTTNPKIGANWEVVQGVKLRANYSKSFVAPALTSRGNAQGITAESNYGNFGGTLTIPMAAYPQAASIPGCSATAATCTIGGAANPGFQINGGNSALQPQKGKTWSFGGDLTPSMLPGLRASVTYWHNEIQGAITAPTASFAVNAPGLQNLLVIYPGGATPAQLAAATTGLPQNATLPSTVYFSYNFQQRNALNLWVEGIDFDVEYTLRTDMGRFQFGYLGSLETKFDQQVGSGGAIFSVMGTTGLNTTFPSIKFNSRGQLGWSNYGVSLDLFWNHTGSYRNWSNTTVTPITRDASTGVPNGGGDLVKSQDTFDLHVAYDFAEKSGLLSGVQIYADGRNIFDKAPSFYNNTNGYDTFAGNPIGRVISVGARKRW